MQSAINDLIGRRCFFCARDGEEARLVCHQKNGDPHPGLNAVSLEQLDEMLRSGDFVRLCYTCHKSTHWAMTYLGMTWDDIERQALGAGGE